MISFTAESDYKSLTKAEAESWLKSITYDELLEFIIEWDYIEHTIPVVKSAEKIYLLSDRNLHVIYQKPMRINIGPLKYQINQENEVYEDFVPKEKRDIKPYIYIGAGSFLLGTLLMSLLN